MDLRAIDWETKMAAFLDIVLTQNFQRRRLKCEKFKEDRRSNICLLRKTKMAAIAAMLEI